MSYSIFKNLFKKKKNKDLLEVYNLSKKWIHNNTIPEKGIIVTNRKDGAYAGMPYPEVSGYYIPTLLEWGERDLAIQYAKWLFSIQHDDGAWYDFRDEAAYTFDTGQVLKGLLAIHDILPEAKQHIIKGCDFLLTQIEEDGEFVTPTKHCWPVPSVTTRIHLYCLSPLREAARLFEMDHYEQAVQKVLSYYLEDKETLLDFHTLSHFYAYIIEALVDLGEIDIAQEAMNRIKKIQRDNGMVPAYKDSRWVCSTGLFQFAVIWYKLGDKEPADKAFKYACSLQNDSGGFNGSTGRGSDYCENEEISWANKYFLDALTWKLRCHFSGALQLEEEYKEGGTYKLEETIPENDGRVQVPLDVIKEKEPKSLIDLGCGKGRILQIVQKENPNIKITGLDVSMEILKELPENINKQEGTILNTKCKDETFDFVLCIEALEHTIDTENSIKEMARITAPRGTVLIIDKSEKCWGMFPTPEWEQWFDEKTLSQLMEDCGLENVSTIKGIPYTNNDGSDNLFIAWQGTKRA